MGRELAISIIDDLDECGRSVTDWEAEFLDSLMKQFEKSLTWVPSRKQTAILEQMKIKYL
jgi:hypothetical protein